MNLRTAPIGDYFFTRRVGLGLATLIPPLLLLPFIFKPVHIDDPLFIWAAQQILKTPLNFYGFPVNWYGHAQPMFQVNQNPPLLAYYLAPFGWLSGWQEWALHAAMLPIAGAAGAGAWLVACRFTAMPTLAALLAVLMPAFFVTATTLMCDMLMYAFWLWAIHFWLQGVEMRRHRWLLCAVMFILLASVTKYFGAALIPLLFVCTLLCGPGRWYYVVYLLFPVMLLAGYDMLTWKMYGIRLISDAFNYAQANRDSMDTYSRLVHGFSFTGGTLIGIGFMSFYFWTGMQRLIPMGLLLLAAALFFGFPVPAIQQKMQQSGWGGAQHFQLIVYVAIGAQILLLLLLDLKNHRNRQSLMLALWIGGTFGFVCFLNHMINARVLMPLALPVALLATRRIDIAASRAHRFERRFPLVALALTCVASLLIARADYGMAQGAKVAASDVRVDHPREKIWFSGHWGFQYYMMLQGAFPVDRVTRAMRPGNLFVVPDNNTNPLRPSQDMIGASQFYEYALSPWISTMNKTTGAGFYGDVFGPLPFVFGAAPNELYVAINLVDTLDRTR